MQVLRAQVDEHAAVEGRIAETLGGIDPELVVLLPEYLHEHRRLAGLQHGVPVAAVQPVEHAEDAHLGQVAAAVVVVQADRPVGEVPQPGHVARIEHVPAERLGDDPDDVQWVRRGADLQRPERIVQVALLLEQLALGGRRLDAQASRQAADGQWQVQRIAFAGQQDRPVVAQGAERIDQAFAQGQAEEGRQQVAPGAPRERGKAFAADLAGAVQQHLQTEQGQGRQACAEQGAVAAAEAGEAAGRDQQADAETVEVESVQVVEGAVGVEQYLYRCAADDGQHACQPRTEAHGRAIMEMQEQSAGEVHRDYIKEGVAQAGSDAPERQPGVVEDDPVLQAQHLPEHHQPRQQKEAVECLGAGWGEHQASPGEDAEA